MLLRIQTHRKTITDVARFKSLVSDSDVVSGRNPFEKPFAQRCRNRKNVSMRTGTNQVKETRFMFMKASDFAVNIE